MRCVVLLAGLLVACSNNPSTSDAGSDAAPSDASPDVAQPNDAGGDAAPTDGGDGGGGGCGSYAYCEDFESYAAGPIANNAKLGPWKATVQGTGITFQVDTVKPYAGKQSLHVTVPSNAGMDAGTTARGTLNQAAASGLVTGNDLYGRAMVFYSNSGGNDLPIGVHSWLFQSTGFSSEGDGGVSMNLGGGGAKLQLNYHPPAPLTEQSVDNGSITAGQWHCIQWQWDGSGNPPNDVAHVWIDGNDEVDVAKTKGWWFATPWDSFDFGFTHFQSLANPVDVYLDDFALDGAMIPCPP